MRAAPPATAPAAPPLRVTVHTLRVLAPGPNLDPTWTQPGPNLDPTWTFVVKTESPDMVRKKWTVSGLLIFRSRFFGLFSAEGWTKPGHFGGQNISPPISNSATVCKFAAPLHGRRSVPGRRHPKNAHIGSRSLCQKVDTTWTSQRGQTVAKRVDRLTKLSFMSIGFRAPTP